MLLKKETVKILVSMTPVDMRKSIDGLNALVFDSFSETPQSGGLFLFFNKKRDKVKIVYWDKNGFVLHYKRLEKGRFHLKQTGGAMEITDTQLQWLLAGLDFQLMNQFSELNYTNYY